MLVVDDDARLRRTLEDVLEELGWDAESVGTGLEGVQQAVQGGYALILLDYQLPDIDGLEVLARLRAADVETPVVAVTGKGDESIATDFLTRGAVDYVAKPSLTPPRLEMILSRAIWVAEGDEARRPAEAEGDGQGAASGRIVVRTDEDRLERLLREGLEAAGWLGELLRITEVDALDPFLEAHPVHALVLDLRDCELAGPVVDSVLEAVDEPVLAVVDEEGDPAAVEDRAASITVDELDGPRLETVLDRLIGGLEDAR